LSFDTDLQNGLGDVKFFVIKNNGPTARSNRFGFSGAHGEWDIILANKYNNYYDANKTGEEYLRMHYALLNAIGVQWIRQDFSWERFEKTQGNYFYDYFDLIFEVAKDYDLNMLISIVFTPKWMYEQCPHPYSVPWFTQPIDLNSGGSPLYDNFVTKLVERYKPHGTKDPDSSYGVSHWQIWNEPDHHFWADCETTATGNIQEYAWLIKSAHAAIKAIDQNAQVMVGGITHLSPVSHFNEFYNNMPGKEFDLLDTHYYKSDTGTTLTNWMNDILDVRDARGDSSKGFWLTETSHGNAGYQSTYLTNVFNQLEALAGRNFEKAFWWGPRGYFFSTDNPNPSERRNAVLDVNFYPKAAYFDFGEWLGTIDYKGEVSASISGNTVRVTIPEGMLNQVGDYVVFFVSKSKMVTTLPLYIEVLPE
jgi:hypothetical protein